MSQGIVLPRWLTRTRTMQMTSFDVVVVMALVLTIHGTPHAIRQAAHNLKDKVCMEHRAKMRALARMEDDAAVMRCATGMVEAATDSLGILVGERFPVRLIEPPRCHLKPMRLAGNSHYRYWKCQHCTHVKPIGVSA